MALETGTYISDLVATNPTGSDPLAFADDHLRLIKATIKATFPNLAGAVTKTHAQINDGLEKAGGTMTGPLVLAGAPSADLQATTKAYVDAAITAARQNAYPVGSVYVNATNATNPASLLGFGTWVAFGAGRVPVGFNAADPLFDAAEETGGSKDSVLVSHTHTATTAITDPGHFHWDGTTDQPYPFNVDNFKYGGRSSGISVANAGYNNGWDGWEHKTNTVTTGITADTTVAAAGSSGTNANLQPYITVYMWKRTA